MVDDKQITGRRITHAFLDNLEELNIKYTHIFSIADYHFRKRDFIKGYYEDRPEIEDDVWDRTKADYCSEMKIDLHIKDENMRDMGLIIMRAQPLHYGHIRTLDIALKENESIIIVLGSTQEFGTGKNPFTFSERKRMLKNYYFDESKSESKWNVIHVVGVKDINDTLRWPEYVLEEIDYELGSIDIGSSISKVYGGSEYDCHWFKNKFEIGVCDRNNTNYEFISGSMIREMLTYGDKRWLNYVPSCNWHIVAKKFERMYMLA